MYTSSVQLDKWSHTQKLLSPGLRQRGSILSPTPPTTDGKGRLRGFSRSFCTPASRASYFLKWPSRGSLSWRNFLICPSAIHPHAPYRPLARACPWPPPSTLGNHSTTFQGHGRRGAVHGDLAANAVDLALSHLQSTATHSLSHPPPLCSEPPFWSWPQ